MTPRGRLLLLVAFLTVLIGASFLRNKSKRPEIRPDPTNSLQIIKGFEEEQARRFWAPELAAETHGRVVEELWDGINASTNKLGLIASTKINGVMLARYDEGDLGGQGIRVRFPLHENRGLSSPEWKALIEAASVDGWNLAQCEFRHIAFSTTPLSSRFYFSAHLYNARREERTILEGDLLITWQGEGLGMIDATKVQVRSRAGAPGFRKVMEDEVQPPDGSYFIDPVIVWDLDGDQSSEIILAAKNRVYRRDHEGHWNHATLCAHDPGLIFTGALGDFSGKQSVDFLCAKFDGLFLYEGGPDGTFPSPPRQVWSAQPRLKYGQALAFGDVDRDGDIDLFLGQYKPPYDKGQMPKPYFDANDGYPSFLLLNDGHGNFTDVTQKAGLGAKRGRRVYNASLIDLDRDGDLDLVVVSDFAGLDAYQNDGSGHFKDVTEAWFSERHAFGMANCFADFNRDGLLDIMMIGMNSPVADRLASLGLQRPYDISDVRMRERVAVGNRLFFGRSDGTFQESPLGGQAARTGWSWGAVAEDLNNDSFPDLYIANGHETRESVKDYETEFWLHDIYVGDSTENSLAQLYFRDKMSQTRGHGWSYGGYEKNRLFLNIGGTNFIECAYLMGVALESDSRNVVAEDVDGDGRLDLVVTTFEIYPNVRQTLQIFRNELEVREKITERRFDSLAKSGQVLTVETNRVEAVLSSGSYRSQIQPRMLEKAHDARASSVRQ